MFKVVPLQVFVALTGLVASDCFTWSSTKRSSRLMMSTADIKPEQAFFDSMEESFRNLGSEYDMNKVVDEFNKGTFKAMPIFGRLRDVTSQPTTIEMMTFNSFPELTLGDVDLVNEGALVYKGENAPYATANPNLYAVRTPFMISNPEFKLEQESGDSFIPTSGVCTVLGTNKLSEDGNTLDIMLEQAELTLRDNNDNVHHFEARDFKSPLPGSHEVLLMTPEITAVKGNFGSLFLFFPVKN